MVTTIQIEEKLKDKLDKLKVHHRESYNDLIVRLINSFSPNNFDKESLIETIEIRQLQEDLTEVLLDNSNQTFY